MSDFARVHVGGGYSSEAEAGSSAGKRRPIAVTTPSASSHRDFGSTMAVALRTSYRPLLQQDGYTRHRSLMANYAHYRRSMSGAGQDNSKSDMDVLREHHQFIRDEEADSNDHTWGKRLALKYYKRLFREYAVADLSRFKEGKIGLRWRTEQEVIDGEGQFTCASKHCAARHKLHSYEINFAYKEGSERELKRALVKVRVCQQCAVKLFYRKIKEAKRQQRLQAKAQKKKEKKEWKRQLKDEKRNRKRGKSKQGHASDDDEPSEASVDYDVLVQMAGGSDSTGASAPEIHEVIEQMLGQKSGGSSSSSSSSNSAGSEPDRKKTKISTDSLQKHDHPSKNAAGSDTSNVWAAPLQAERTKEDDYDDYLEGLFM